MVNLQKYVQKYVWLRISKGSIIQISSAAFDEKPVNPEAKACFVFMPKDTGRWRAGKNEVSSSVDRLKKIGVKVKTYDVLEKPFTKQLLNDIGKSDMYEKLVQDWKSFLNASMFFTHDPRSFFKDKDDGRLTEVLNVCYAEHELVYEHYEDCLEFIFNG